MHSPKGQKVKGQSHTVTKTVTVASKASCQYGRLLLLPAWVCMSIRLPIFSSSLATVLKCVKALRQPACVKLSSYQALSKSD